MVEYHRSTKIVDFAIPAPVPEAMSKAPCISWISCFQGRRNEWHTTKAPKLSILQYPLLFRRPSPRPLVYLYPLLFQRPFPRPLGFPDFRLLRPPKWGKLHKSSKIVDFATPAPFPVAISNGFPVSKAAEMRGTQQKHQNCRFCITRSFSGGHFQGPLYILDFRLPRPPKWTEHHKSTKIADFAIPAPFPKAISKAPWIPWISGFHARPPK